VNREPNSKWSYPQDIDAANAAFQGRVRGTLMPLMEDIPREFTTRGNAWADEVSKWFFDGVAADYHIVPAEGIDRHRAMRHLSICLWSFEPKHEHKIAGCAYLMSLWFLEFGKARRSKEAA
jgi:hypothetical protein